jgi:cytochrome c oxidase cbb3-type subunit 3
VPKSGAILLIATLLLTAGFVRADTDPGLDFDSGKAVYRFYCYQCHAYSGDARTLSSTYLDPKPRDFTAFTEDTLPVERMLAAVRDGRPNTAMVRFSSVLSEAEIQSVVEYIRDSLLGNPDTGEKYHSPENGWQNHEKYRDAFPFIEGSVALRIPWENLTPAQQSGRRLYESACISCHDQPYSAGGDAIWETRAVSYPRDHFSHRSPPLDMVSGASPYARHDIPTVPDEMSDLVARGLDLYQANCAFCHAPDGTGKNWIGSFLEPRPRDFTTETFVLGNTPVALREIIKSGLPDTSMPAWRHVLADDEIDAIVAYINIAFQNE